MFSKEVEVNIKSKIWRSLCSAMLVKEYQSTCILDKSDAMQVTTLNYAFEEEKTI